MAEVVAERRLHRGAGGWVKRLPRPAYDIVDQRRNLPRLGRHRLTREALATTLCAFTFRANDASTGATALDDSGMGWSE
jgi:hypothetical protein